MIWSAEAWAHEHKSADLACPTTDRLQERRDPEKKARRSTISQGRCAYGRFCQQVLRNHTDSSHSNSIDKTYSSCCFRPQDVTVFNCSKKYYIKKDILKDLLIIDYPERSKAILHWAELQREREGVFGLYFSAKELCVSNAVHETK